MTDLSGLSPHLAPIKPPLRGFKRRLVQVVLWSMVLALLGVIGYLLTLAGREMLLDWLRK